ncbi:MAG TPA: serine/threonine-protein kinase [Thermoanaerobaculia bacterium]|nr:serine/threonine-protein kinase [Thermoanaerobaculia bacterium]
MMPPGPTTDSSSGTPDPTETVYLGPGPAPAGQAPAGLLPRGTAIGRYVILDRIGGGGMGVVYTGYDPELDRKVALKLLRPDRAAGEAARLRLLREAQAIARLSHPNVVAVHDAGTFGDQVFLAMEYVEGTTLRRWLDEERRPWGEVVDRFGLAGRGLAAAHAAGLVHRDFKPDNVLLGKDGRVRVADFGLARAAGETGAEEPASPESGGILESPITQLGTAVGTPAYMAPEQLRGERADARSDQFSFCVALWEALYGERPFAGVAARGEVREVPAGSRVPDRIRQALLRGLSADPALRYPALEELLDHLARNPEAARRRWLAAGAAVLAVGGVFAGLGYLQAQRGQLCSGGEAKLAPVWNAERKEAGRQAFLATGLPYAPESWNRAEKALDTYLGGWAAMHRDACEATRLRGEQSEDLLDRRVFCLDQRLGEARALTDLFARADEGVVMGVDDAVSKLGKVELCTDTEALTARVPPPRDPALRARVEEARSRLAAAKALADAGKHTEALPGARDAVAAARRTGYRPLEAEALYLQGYLEDKLAESREAEATMFEALVTAQGGGDFLTAGQASAQLAWIVGSQQSRVEDGRRWLRMAQATVDGFHGGAAARSEVLKQLAGLLYQEGDYAEAARVARQAIVLAERGYGSEHPQVANLHSNLGIFLLMAGRKEEALAASLQGLEIRRKALAPGHPDLARSYNTLGNIYSDMGRPELALENYRLAFEIFRDRYGASHPQTVGVGSNLADLARNAGRYGEAMKLYQDELRTAEKVHGPEHPEVARIHDDIGEILLLEKRPGEALAKFRRALSIYEKVLGPDHPDTAFALQRIGVALTDLGRPREAVPPLERSLRLREGKDVDRGLVGESRWYLALALWDGGGDRRRALVLARAALEDYQADDRPQKDVEILAAWVRERER